MERPTKFNAESPQNANALILSNDLVHLLPDVSNEAGQLVLPVFVAENLFGFEIREDLQKYLQEGLVIGLFVSG